MFTGIKELIILILKRERIKLPIWILAISISLILMVPLLKDVYGDQKSLTALYQTFATNPAGIFLTGPMDKPTFGALMSIETLLWWGLAVAFMNTMFVIRHNRQNEENGALELILSARVHRFAGLIAAIIVAFFANLILALIIGAGISAVNVNWQDGSVWLFAISFGLFGFVWAVLASIVAQLVESARSANSILASLIGIGFVLRGISDFMGKQNSQGLLEPAWPTYLSPFGWLESAKSLTAANWWPLWIFVVVAIVLTPISFYLLANRDLGSGIIAARKGKTRASAFLRTPIGFTWKMQQNIFIGWLIGVVIMVATIGFLVPQISNVYEGSPEAVQMIETMGGSDSMIPSFISAMLSIVVLMIIAYVLQSLGKLRGEEGHGHLEVLLSTKLSRIQWFALHALVALIGGAVMLAISGWLMAVSVNAGSKDMHADISKYILSALQYWPVLALFAGLYILLFGILPKASGLVTWLYYGFTFFAAWLAPLMNLKQWIMNLSPMVHIASAPAEAIKGEPLLIITGISIVLIAIGTYTWRNRDVLNH
ncbi:MAG: hypothetical protein QM613_01960 [Micrococcaceae bacterium]